MYALVFTSRFIKSFRKLQRSGRFPLAKFEHALTCLRGGEKLPANVLDHALAGPLVEFREFHLDYDLLVQYKQDESRRIITLSKIGTHAELFGH